MKKITKLFVLFFLSLILLINLSFSQTFTKIDTGIIAEDLGPSCGSSWGDYDNDGLLDLFVCNWTVDAGGTQNFLYHNEGNGYFTKIESGAIVDEIGFFSLSAWGDYDNDGFLYLVVPNRDGNVMLFHNNTNGDFEKIDNTALANLNEHFMGSSWIDLNKDGYLDLFLVTYSTNYLFQNSDAGNFIEINNTVLNRANKRTTFCSWADYDNDGDLDVFIPVYPGTNLFYINNGDGSFSLDSETNIINDEYSIDGRWSDCNNDGFLDLFVLNMDDQSPPNSLYLNNGNGTFEKINSGSIVTDQGASLGCSWGDFDNDGDLDLFVSNMDYQGYKNNLYLNNGTGEFTKATEGVIINENGADISVCDFDNDGDLDILITDGGPNGVPAANYLYSNDGNDNNWINIKPIGTTSNTTGAGARLKLKATIFGSEVWQIRERNKSSMRAHFGLGDAPQVDSLIVQWSCGQTQLLTNVSVNQFLEITKPTANHDVAAIPVFKRSNQVTLFTDFQPEIIVKNFGSTDQSNLMVSYEIDSVAWEGFSDTWTIEMLKSDSLKTVMFTPLGIYQTGNYNLTYFTKLSNDEIRANDSLKSRLACTNLVDDFEWDLNNWNINFSGSELSSAFKYSGNYNLNIKYENDSESWAEFKQVFDLSKLENAYISFYERYFLEPNKDFACLEISSDGGANWEQIGEHITGVVLNWVKKEIDLTNYCGSGFDEIKLRFKIIPNLTTILPGWYLDDIAIYSGKISNIHQTDKAIPNEYRLLTNYPNPFNAHTTIQYQLPSSCRVKIVIYNLLGKEIITLIEKKQPAGHYRLVWDGNDRNGNPVSSGIYHYQMTSDNYSSTRKMLLLK